MRTTYWTFNGINYAIMESKGGLRPKSVRIYRLEYKVKRHFLFHDYITTEQAIDKFFNGKHSGGTL